MSKNRQKIREKSTWKLKKEKYHSQIEINDLIDDAVKNAVTRRNEVLDSEEALLSMSDEEAKSVAGGVSIILGILIKPIIIGLIANPTPTEY